MLKKYKTTEIEFALVYFNSTTKTLINAFQEILHRIDSWINERSGWIAELIVSQYINISTYIPLSGSSFVQLLVELRSSKKEL